jgi:pilus assembly protein TadC
MLYVIFAVVFGAVAAGSYAWLRPGDDTVGRRIRPAGGSVAPESRYQGSFSSRVLAPAFAGLGRRLANLLPQNIVRNLNAMLIAANEPVTLPIFLAVWLAFSATGFLLFAWVISTSDGMTPLRTIVLAVAVLPTAAFLPYVWMQHKVRVRQKQIVRELPDALDLLVTTWRPGSASTRRSAWWRTRPRGRWRTRSGSICAR